MGPAQGFVFGGTATRLARCKASGARATGALAPLEPYPPFMKMGVPLNIASISTSNATSAPIRKQNQIRRTSQRHVHQL